MSYKVEVTTPGDRGVYTSNALRFATREEADEYGHDLAWRWAAVTDWRVAESDAQVTALWSDGLIHLED